jgi:hypothetical protein
MTPRSRKILGAGVATAALAAAKIRCSIASFQSRRSPSTIKSTSPRPPKW